MVAEDESERNDLFYALMNLRCRALVGVSCDIFDCFVVLEARLMLVHRSRCVRNLTFTLIKKWAKVSWSKKDFTVLVLNFCTGQKCPLRAATGPLAVKTPLGTFDPTFGRTKSVSELHFYLLRSWGSRSRSIADSGHPYRQTKDATTCTNCNKNSWWKHRHYGGLQKFSLSLHIRYCIGLILTRASAQLLLHFVHTYRQQQQLQQQ